MKIKYPRTYHLPWSKTASVDDKRMTTFQVQNLMRHPLIITEKMDGENTTLANTYWHARSLDSVAHPVRDWLINFWATIKHDVPPHMRICGENVYATHSIYYNQLPSYFLGFGIWVDDHCLSWAETKEWFELLGIVSVPILAEIDGQDLMKFVTQYKDIDAEGYVVRAANGFHLNEFGSMCGKYVRQNHVQTDKHWIHSQIRPNKLETAIVAHAPTYW